MRLVVSVLTCLVLWSSHSVPVSAAVVPARQVADSGSRPARPDKLPTSFWPADVPFDKSIPTPKSHFGFDIGFRHLDHAQVVSYLQRLAAASDRISLQSYAQSHGGRPLLMLTITSPRNRERLKQIRADHRRLSRPGSAPVNLAQLPAVITMGYGVHGDEASATNCAPLVAYYLAAAKGPQVQQWLDSCVILLDPSLNPDGFDRFANWANRYRGRVPNADPQHAEHNQMWPPGRVNYYWFDLNRDWLPLVHPESQGRLRLYHQWKPNVVLDFHEMGSGSTYFFQPGIPERTNPLTPPKNQELTRKFATYHSKKLDQRGSLYFTQERFDDFYMGKGSTYPDLHGSVGILFEQASSRGHVQANQDGLLRFYDTIANQFTTSLTSLQATTDMRLELLEYQQRFYEQSIEQAAQATTQAYAFSISQNPTRLDRFAALLKQHDIDCYRLKQDLNQGDHTLDAESTLIVPAVQPEHRFLLSLLMRDTSFRENIFYDVSSWTVPLAYGLQQTDLSARIAPERLIPFQSFVPASKPMATDKAPIAYLIDYRDDASALLLTRLLRSGVQVRIATQPFTASTASGSTSFPRGTLSVIVATQPGKRAAMDRILKTQAGDLRSSVTPVRSGLSQSGPDIGSPSFSLVQSPKLAMLIGPSTSAYLAGEAWHSLDRQLAMPLTLLKDEQFSRANLDDYTTLILPDGSISDANWEVVQQFAHEGGTVVVLGEQAVAVQTRLNAMPKNDQAPALDTDATTASPSAGTLQQPFDSASNQRALQLISGAIFQTRIDLTHPLLYGFSESRLPVFRNHASFLTPSTNVYCNPVIYDDQQPLLAGYCSSENLARFKGGVSVVVQPTGRGRMILMADDPNFRGFWQATNRMFINALLLGNHVDP